MSDGFSLCKKGDKKMKIKRDKDFISSFNPDTGFYFRTGILKDGKDTGVDPFMASFPELLDVGIMGHCKHGKTGLCKKAGIGCYQDGLHSNKDNMSLEDFKNIVRQCKGRTFQFALGGCGDPDQHENFEEILKECREADIIPNFTTSGFGMNKALAKTCKKYCGAVAVSWYRSEYTIKAIDLLLAEGVKTNVHYVLSRSTLREALTKLKNDLTKSNAGFPKGINAVIFLLHKPVGLGTKEEIITKDNNEFWEFLNLINDNKFPYKIGFDSCTVPALLHLNKVSSECLDTCEGSRWSAYITSDMKLLPCSFDNQKQKWAVDLAKHSIEDAWNSDTFEDFRKHFRSSCPNCDKHTACMGGCPIVPEIVMCSEKH